MCKFLTRNQKALHLFFHDSKFNSLSFPRSIYFKISSIKFTYMPKHYQMEMVIIKEKLLVTVSSVWMIIMRFFVSKTQSFFIECCVWYFRYFLWFYVWFLCSSVILTRLIVSPEHTSKPSAPTFTLHVLRVEKTFFTIFFHSILRPPSKLLAE